MLIRVTKENEIIKYPYWPYDVSIDFPSIRLTGDLQKDSDILKEVDILYVKETPSPEVNMYTHRVEELNPIYKEGFWIRQWIVIELSDIEKQTLKEFLANEKRQTRNKLLLECDWTQCKDISEEISSKWLSYRQALRDITKQSNFPIEIVWPTPPTA